MDIDNFQPIKKVKISDAVFTELLETIKSGKWEPGHKLPSENSLSDAFNVSRGSIRSALHKLEAIGFIETRDGQGTFVKKVNMKSVLGPVFETIVLSPKDIIDILEFRKLIEQKSAMQMALNHSAQQIDELAECIEKMNTLAHNGDYQNYSIWDNRFHTIIVSNSHNHIMIMAYDLLFESMYSHLCAMNKSFGFELGMSHHMKIYNAIKNGDEHEASACIVNSINDSIKRLYDVHPEFHDRH